MEEAADHYGILNVRRNATAAQIRAAFRRLAARFHPDRNPGDAGAENRFKEISRAYSILSNAQKREVYDRVWLRKRVRIPRARVARPPRRKGRTIRVRFEIDLDEAASGCERPVSIERTESCPRCRGTGRPPADPARPCAMCQGSGRLRFTAGRFKLRRDCFRCRGTGQALLDSCAECAGMGTVRVKRVLRVKVPAGLGGPTRDTLVGQGHASETGGAPGDVRIRITIRPCMS